jgi:hypothetical protein
MIWGHFEEPNYKFTARDRQGYEYCYFCRSESEQELHDRLGNLGLTVLEIKEFKFSEWKERARDATDRAIWQRIRDRWVHFGPQAKGIFSWLSEADLAAISGRKRKLVEAVQSHDRCSAEAAIQQVEAWTSKLEEESPPPAGVVSKTAISFNEKIWGEMKWHLFEQFHGKCAYCESKVQATYPGDVEHYRPKGKVDEDKNHPGYYWLAYDEKNMLPSCILCNQYRAKMTHFPVAGEHSRDPRNVGSEQPLLLNPYNQNIDPSDHLEFEPTGVSMERDNSPYGSNSRQFYHLDRPGLSGERFDAMTLVAQDWNGLVNRKVGVVAAYRELKDEILAGKRPYSLALLCQLKRLKEQTIRDLQAL